MDLIYHEKQDGLLCGQHCLNNLLQGEYFSAVELAEIGNQMDMAERHRMAEMGMDTDDYLQFLAQPSNNMDDSGMFSVQVLATALRIWDLALLPLGSSSIGAQEAKENPCREKAFICNYREHWFTIRKLGQQWFNVNSLLSYPELISDTYLSLFLHQLQMEGYSIFIVEGILPECEADEALKKSRAVQTTKPKLLSEISPKNHHSEDSDLRIALSASLTQASSSDHLGQSSVDTEEDDLQKAIRLSLGGASEGATAQTFTPEVPSTPDQTELRERRLARFARLPQP